MPADIIVESMERKADFEFHPSITKTELFNSNLVEVQNMWS